MFDPQAIDKTLFGPSGRYNTYRWHRLPDSVKDQIFTPEGLHQLQEEGMSLCANLDTKSKAECRKVMNELLPRECRCIPEVAAADVFRYGDVTHNPYAVCQASLSRSRFGHGIHPSDIRSLLAVASRKGECSTSLNVKKVPTTFLYGYAVEHLHTSKGRRAFEGKIPALDEFLKAPGKWRTRLIDLVSNYIASAHPPGGVPVVHGRYETLLHH
jgi:hypothetical protein